MAKPLEESSATRILRFRRPRPVASPRSIGLSTSWVAWALYVLILVPIEDRSRTSLVVVAAWALLNLAVAVGMASRLRRSRYRGSASDGEVSADSEPSDAELAEEVPVGDDASDDTTPSGKTSLWRDAMRRLRGHRMACLSLGLLITMALLCFTWRVWYEIAGSTVAPTEDPGFYALHVDPIRIDEAMTFAPPSLAHWFGTDSLGRDVFARVLYGGSVSFQVAFVATLVSICIGVLWGAISGYAGGWVDRWMMRFVDVLYGLPYMFLVILILSLVSGLHTTATENHEHLEAISRLESAGDRVAAEAYALEHGIDSRVRAASLLARFVSPMVAMFFALGLVQWLTMARITRGQVLSLREREFVTAARVSGARMPRILRKHIIPNLLGPVVVYTTLTVPTVLLAEAFLSFLGLGISQPYCSWGSLASEGIEGINVLKPYWWLLAYPSAALALALFSLNFLGDGLRDALDPRGRAA